MAEVASVVATIRGNNYPLTYSSTSQNWALQASAPLTTSYNQNADHTDHITITVTDTAGNTAVIDQTSAEWASELRLRVLEVTEPTVTYIYPTAGAVVDTGEPVIRFRVDDEVNGSGVSTSTLYLNIAGNVIPSTSPNLTFTPDGNGYIVEYAVQAPIPDGPQTLTVGVADFDGNESDRETITFNVLTTEPVLNITNPGNEETLTNEQVWAFAGSTERPGTTEQVTLTITLNGTDITTEANPVIDAMGDFTCTGVTLPEGTNTIVFTATNASGLSTSVTRTIVVDITPPSVTAISITPNPVDVGALLTITITAVDG